MSAVVAAQSPLVRAIGVHKSFGDNEVLKGITLDVAHGEVVVILGPSGSGKSTFLRCLNHLESIDKGAIEIGGEQIGYKLSRGRLVRLHDRTIVVQRRSISMVFQQFNLYPHMTALENIIEAPVGVHGVPRESAIAYAQELLARVGLSDKQDAYPRQMSGGQQQRVAIGLLQRPEMPVVFFYDPISALNTELVGEVLSTMRDLADGGLTMIVVTHEIGFAKEAADRVVFMDGGVVVEQGPPGQILANPTHPRTQAFLKRFLG